VPRVRIRDPFIRGAFVVGIRSFVVGIRGRHTRTDSPSRPTCAILTRAPFLEEPATMTHTIRTRLILALLALVISAYLTPAASAQTATPPATSSPTATAVPATPTPAPTADPARLQRTENFLVLGADVRPGPWMMHTDSIMLVAIDRDTEQVGILSIPRDLWVDIPGWGMDRINSAYFLGDYTKYKGGSPALAKDTVEKAIGVPIDHVVLIKMDGLAQLVDALGGITVKLDCPLYEQTPDPKNPNKMVNWSLPAGEVTLNGDQARKFATYRYLTSDFGRAQRQQQLIWAIRDRAESLDIVGKIPQLWTALSASFKTDLSVLDVLRLARFGLALDSKNVTGASLAPDVIAPYKTKGGAAVLVIKDKASLNKRLGEMFTAKPLAELGKSAGKCPPAPAGFKPYPTPTPKP
jgi:LCP family protein required for cell wall assembly